MSAPELKYVPIAQLIEATNNYRRSHDPVKHAELVASVRTQGILTPLVVRQVTQDPEWLYEVAAGHRRLRAARAAGIETVPVSVRAMSDAEFVEVMITENVQRVDPDPLDEADAYQEMINSLGYDVATLAAKFGKSETYVRQRLVLTKLAAEVRTALADGAIELGHAVLLARTDEARQVELLRTELLASYRMSRATHRETFADSLGVYDAEEGEGSEADAVVIDVRRTRTTVGELRIAMARQLLPLAPVKWDRDDAALVPSAGSCTACPKRTGANPALFEELDPADDRCPDASCYGAKKQAYLEARVRACRSQAPTLVVISTAYSRKLKDVAGLPVLKHHVDWAPAKEGKRGNVPALVVESGHALEDWQHVGELREVQLVKAGKKPAKQNASGDDWQSRDQRQAKARGHADERYWVALRAVVRDCKACCDAAGDVPAALATAQARLAALVLCGTEFDYQVQELVSEELGDPALARAEILQLSDETLLDPSMQLAAALLCIGEEIEQPKWWGKPLPTIDEATQTYPIPPALVSLAASVGLDAAHVWATAIEAYAPAGAA
jgi:ParB family transcriptional regulator, chromosome partitioning protein